MKTLILGLCGLLPLISFAQQTISIECKNPDKGVTIFKMKSGPLSSLNSKDIHQITHSKIKAEYWEVSSKALNSLTINYALEDGPASMYLDGQYTATLSQKQVNSEFSLSFYRRYNGETLSFGCRKL
jgi:hypothetical protein